jgi:hypothetical protein
MTPFASGFNMDKIRSSADIIEEVDGITTYLGFCQPGTTGTDQPQWSIMKIVETGSLPTLTVFKWATGSCAYNLVWDLRAGYDYKFKTF